ncbi:MAG TPA: sulfite exporter TauE/SafE family protein [Gaiellaceae bacterium]|nr:sulfite exporter TauE/SafE family protein [Gaiellaceae bacterium]
MEAWRLALTFGASFAAGYLGSVVGLVLGTLRLPAVLLAAGNPAAAAGTNIAISAAAAASGGWRHAREGRVDWRVVAWMAPASVVGAVVGGLLGGSLPERALFAGIAAILAWNGLDLLVRPVRARPRTEPRVWPAAVFGLAIGVVGGAIGVILGTLRMPALLGAVGMDARRAVGTNLVVGFFLGVAGFAAHAARLEVEWDLLAAGLLGAIPGAWLGARKTGGLSEETLRRLIGVALLAIAVAFAIEAIAA